MDPEHVKRVIALSRQIAQYQAMYRKGVLTKEETIVAIKECEREITNIRSQGVLALQGGETAPEKARKP